MPRMRLRHLMVLIAYVAVALALVVAVMRVFEENETAGATAAAILLAIPWVPAGFCWFVLRRGPYRDWVVALHMAVGLTLLAGALASPFLLFIVHALAPWARRPVGPSQLALTSAALPVGLVVWIGAFSLYRRNLKRLECPGCKRKQLVRSLKTSHKAMSARCGACDEVFVLHPFRRGQACPKCARNTLFARSYAFHWCLSCGGRAKRLRRGPWEQAPSPQDDPFYSLWDLGEWFQHLSRRIRSRARTQRKTGHEWVER